MHIGIKEIQVMVSHWVFMLLKMSAGCKHSSKQIFNASCNYHNLKQAQIRILGDNICYGQKGSSNIFFNHMFLIIFSIVQLF